LKTPWHLYLIPAYLAFGYLVVGFFVAVCCWLVGLLAGGSILYMTIFWPALLPLVILAAEQ